MNEQNKQRLSLAETHPELAAEWHPWRNGELRPENVTAGCNKKVWWLLPYNDPNTGKHFDFEWKAKVVNRSKGTGCPYLSGRVVWKGFNDLTTTHPEIAIELHPTKNGNLKPENVIAGSSKKVWWYLPYDDPITGNHFDFEWEAIVKNRVGGHNCPYLSGHATWPGFNDLATTHPELVSEWHPTKNGNLRPEDVVAGSGKKVWWLLPYDDPNTGKHFDFEWEIRIADRANGNKCPYLSNQAVWPGFNDLVTTHPELASQWHPTKNGDLKPEHVTAGCNKKVWWLLPYNVPMNHPIEYLRGKYFDFEWESTVADRSKGSGCPYLSGRSVWSGFNDLATIHPQLATEWHPTKNRNLKPENVTAGSEQKVWWLLLYDDPNTGKHFDFEWEAKVEDRINGNGCPYLSNQTVWPGFNDLATTHPALASQWHPWKNKTLKPEDVTAGSGKKVWWLLPYDDLNTGKHFDFEWGSTIMHRVQGRNCPYLTGNKVWTGFNDLATTHPELAKEWHPTKNENLTPQDVSAGCNKKVWWLLSYNNPNTGEYSNFEWKSTIVSRANGCGCPFLTVWKSERLIRSILIDSNIKFEEQKRFKDTGRCAFDFYLPTHNIIIEPDGEQHFTGWYKDKDKSLACYIKNDTLKNNFCLNNRIAILRIPHIFDPTKQENEIKSMITNFIRDKIVPEEIIDFYSKQEGHNYHEVATKMNQRNMLSSVA